MKNMRKFMVVNIVALALCNAATAFSLEPCWSVYSGDTLPIYSGFVPDGDIEDFASLGQGVLKLNSIGTNLYGWYVLASPQVLDFDEGVTLSFRARLLSSEGGGSAAISICDRNTHGITIELLTNLLNLTNIATASVTTSQFHEYLVSIKTGTNNLKVYLDSAATPILTRTLPMVTSSMTNSIYFGDLTSTADANWEISDIAWTSLGAFTPGFSGIAGDLNFDCRVNLADYSILALNWLNANTEINLSGPAAIDAKDLAVLTSNYLKEPDNSTLYISDLSIAQPAASLAQTNSASKWVVIPYETPRFDGKMLGSFSFNYLPDITIPLPVSGWHSLYIAYWNPDFAVDGTLAFKYKLSNDAAFTEIHETSTQDTQDATYFREVFARSADLTGQNLVIGKLNDLMAKKTFIAYLKLVPLTPQQVATIIADRSQSATRTAIAAIDTKELFKTTQISSPNDLKRILEPYRFSDINKVLLTVGYGDQVTYDADANDVTWLADCPQSTILTSSLAGSDMAAGRKQMALSLRSLDTANSPLENTIAAAAHAMGLKFDILFNMALSGGFPGWPTYDPNSFVNKNQAYWQVHSDGTKARKASYAFSQVQNFFIALMDEAVRRTDANGVCLSFDKGPHFISQRDAPFITAFSSRYGINPRSLPAADPRLGVIRSEMMTAMMTLIRQKLDQIESQSGRQLTLSVWVWPSAANHAYGLTPKQEGVDVNAWLAAGLIDAVYCPTPDPNYIAWCQAYSRTFAVVLSAASPAASPPAIVAQSYGLGVNSFVFSSVQSSQVFPENWFWMSRIGHQSEILNWNSQSHAIRNLGLNTVNEVDVRQGLAATVYSGG